MESTVEEALSAHLNQEFEKAKTNGNGKTTEIARAEIMDLFGVKYFEPGLNCEYVSPAHHLYSFRAYAGLHEITVERGDSIVFLGMNDEGVLVANWLSGPEEVTSKMMAIVVRGYSPDEKSVLVRQNCTLPYVNGCATKQIFPPERLGDPTLQMLTIPAHSAEQAHHIHSTVRVVYVLSGKGVSIVGMEGKEVKTELIPGMVCVLEPMCPHHFETPQGEPITVIPFHVFSSMGAAESNHPMFNGTHLMNQGA